MSGRQPPPGPGQDLAGSEIGRGGRRSSSRTSNSRAMHQHSGQVKHGDEQTSQNTKPGDAIFPQAPNLSSTRSGTAFPPGLVTHNSSSMGRELKNPGAYRPNAQATGQVADRMKYEEERKSHPPESTWKQEAKDRKADLELFNMVQNIRVKLPLDLQDIISELTVGWKSRNLVHLQFYSVAWGNCVELPRDRPRQFIGLASAEPLNQRKKSLKQFDLFKELDTSAPQFYIDRDKTLESLWTMISESRMFHEYYTRVYDKSQHEALYSIPVAQEPQEDPRAGGSSNQPRAQSLEERRAPTNHSRLGLYCAEGFFMRQLRQHCVVFSQGYHHMLAEIILPAETGQRITTGIMLRPIGRSVTEMTHFPTMVVRLDEIYWAIKHEGPSDRNRGGTQDEILTRNPFWGPLAHRATTLGGYWILVDPKPRERAEPHTLKTRSSVSQGVSSMRAKDPRQSGDSVGTGPKSSFDFPETKADNRPPTSDWSKLAADDPFRRWYMDQVTRESPDVANKTKEDLVLWCRDDFIEKDDPWTKEQMAKLTFVLDTLYEWYMKPDLIWTKEDKPPPYLTEYAFPRQRAAPSPGEMRPRVLPQIVRWRRAGEENGERAVDYYHNPFNEAPVSGNPYSLRSRQINGSNKNGLGPVTKSPEPVFRERVRNFPPEGHWSMECAEENIDPCYMRNPMLQSRCCQKHRYG